MFIIRKNLEMEWFGNIIKKAKFKIRIRNHLLSPASPLLLPVC